MSTALAASKEITGDEFMKKGDEAWQAGKFDDAAGYYGKAAKKFTDKDAQAKAYFHKGLGFYQMGQWDSALDSFEKSKSLNGQTKLSQELHYYTGLCYYAKRNKALAQDHLQKAVATDVGFQSGITELSKLFLNRTKNLKEKKFSMFSSLGYMFSNNVPLHPLSGAVNDTNVREQQGHAVNILLEPNYATFLGNRSVFTFSNTLFSNFNLTSDHRAYDTYKYKIASAVKIPGTWKNTPFYLSLPLGYDVAFSGVETVSNNTGTVNKGFFDQISNAYTFSPSIQFICSSRWDTTIDAIYDYEDYKEGRGPNSRDGFKYSGGLSEGVHALGMHWNGGYHYAYFSAEGKNYDSDTHAFHLNTNFPFWFRTNVNLTSQLALKKFFNHANARRDFGQNYGLTVVRVFDNLVGASFNTTVARNTAEPATTSYNLFTVSTNVFYNF